MKINLIEVKSPDMKYYAFDWDDNIVHMPTKIILKDSEGNEIGMSTSDYAEYRGKVGKGDFEYKGRTIVGLADDPFRNFTVRGDQDFLTDSMSAKPGPAFKDFREAINNGSIFSIITARGHNPNTLKEAVYNLIVSKVGGLNPDTLIKNLDCIWVSAGSLVEYPPEKTIRTQPTASECRPSSIGLLGN